MNIRSSNLFRIRLCPGSAQLEAQVPDETSVWAEEGTLLHYHDAFPTAPREDLSEEQVELLEENSGLRGRFFTATKDGLNIQGVSPKIFKEREFVLCDSEGQVVMNGDKPVTGHPDLIEFYRERSLAVVWDSKFGFKRVSGPDVNLQMKSYAIMVADDLGVDTVLVAISQPRLRSTSHHVFDRAQIEEARREILSDIKTAQAPNPQFNPSAEACNYCRAKAFCKPAMDMTARIGETKVGDLTLEQLEAVGKQIQAAKLVIKAWETRIRYICTAKPGLLKIWSLGKPQDVVEITDPRAAFQRLVDAGLLTADQAGSALYFQCCYASRYQLEKNTKRKRRVRHYLDEYLFADGRVLYVAGEGRLVNLASAEGHPSEVMSLSFCGQALACEYLVKNRGKLPNEVITLPKHIDDDISHLQLTAMGLTIDELTPEQQKYLASWQEGT